MTIESTNGRSEVDVASPPPSDEPMESGDGSAQDVPESVGDGRRARLEGIRQRLEQIPSTLWTDDASLRGRVQARLEAISKRIGTRQVLRLLVYRKRIRKTLEEVPKRMQLVTNQARLVFELVEDFIEGRYREVPWHSVLIATGALVYSVSPADVFPDYIPMVGALDDMVVLSLAMKMIERDLRKYCEFKNYDIHDYFPR